MAYLNGKKCKWSIIHCDKSKKLDLFGGSDNDGLLVTTLFIIHILFKK